MRMNSPGDLAELGTVFGFAPPAMLRSSPFFVQGEALVAGGFVPTPAVVRMGGRLTVEGGSDVAVPVSVPVSVPVGDPDDPDDHDDPRRLSRSADAEVRAPACRGPTPATTARSAAPVAHPATAMPDRLSSSAARCRPPRPRHRRPVPAPRCPTRAPSSPR